MDEISSKLEQFRHQLSGLANVSIVPWTNNGCVFLRYSDSQKLYAFDCSFSEVLGHAIQSGGEEFWPGMDPFQAQLALFSVHVMETIETASIEAHMLSYGKRGLEAVKGKLPPAAVHHSSKPEYMRW